MVAYVKKEFLAPDTEITDEFGDEISLYLDLDLCKKCKAELGNDLTEDTCEGCERTEYIQIELSDDIEADFKTIYGTNDFYDLTKPEGAQKSPDWSIALKLAWEKDPQGGAEASIAKLVEDNPELAQGVDSKLLKRGRRALKGDAV